MSKRVEKEENKWESTWKPPSSSTEKEEEWISLEQVFSEYGLSKEDLDRHVEYWGVVPQPCENFDNLNEIHEGMWRNQAQRVQVLSLLSKKYNVSMQINNFDRTSPKASKVWLYTLDLFEAILTRCETNTPITKKTKDLLAVIGHLYHFDKLMDALCVGPAAFLADKESLFSTFAELHNQLSCEKHYYVEQWGYLPAKIFNMGYLIIATTAVHRLHDTVSPGKNILDPLTRFQVVKEAPAFIAKGDRLWSIHEIHHQQLESIAENLMALPTEKRGHEFLRLVVRRALQERDRRKAAIREIAASYTVVHRLVEFLGAVSNDCDFFAEAIRDDDDNEGVVFDRAFRKYRQGNRERIRLAVNMFIKASVKNDVNFDYEHLHDNYLAKVEGNISWRKITNNDNLGYPYRSLRSLVQRILYRSKEAPTSKLVGIDANTEVLLDLLTESPFRRKKKIIHTKKNNANWCFFYPIEIGALVDELDPSGEEYTELDEEQTFEGLIYSYIQGRSFRGPEEILALGNLMLYVFNSINDIRYYFYCYLDYDELYTYVKRRGCWFTSTDYFDNYVTSGHCSYLSEDEDEEDEEDEEEEEEEEEEENSCHDNGKKKTKLPQTWSEAYDDVREFIDEWEFGSPTCSYDDLWCQATVKDIRAEILAEYDCSSNSSSESDDEDDDEDDEEDEWISWETCTLQYGLCERDLKFKYLTLIPKPTACGLSFGVWRSQARRAQAYAILSKWGAPESVIVRASCCAGPLGLFVEVEKVVHASYKRREGYFPFLYSQENNDLRLLQMLGFKFQAAALMSMALAQDDSGVICTSKQALFEEFIAINNRRGEHEKYDWLPTLPHGYHLVRDGDGDWVLVDPRPKLERHCEPITTAMILSAQTQSRILVRRILDERDEQRQRMISAFQVITPILIEFLDHDGSASRLPDTIALAVALPDDWLFKNETAPT